MSALDSPVFCDFLRELGAMQPRVGQVARVDQGKHAGVVGRITWHGRDKFSAAFRYCDDAQAHMRDVMGRWGFRVRIEPEHGEPFFVGAEKILVCYEATA